MTENSHCTIRPSEEKDLPALTALYRAFVDETVSNAPDARVNPRLRVDRAAARLMRAKGASLFVADIDGTVAGFVYAQFRPGHSQRKGLSALLHRLSGSDALTPVLRDPCAWLAHLYVAPGFRRRGIATGLLHAAADWGRLQGAKTLELNVLASNESARKLYDQEGMGELLVQYRMALGGGE